MKNNLYYETPELVFEEVMVEMGFYGSDPGTSEGTDDEEW